MREPPDKSGLLDSATFRILRWTIALIGALPLAMLVIGLIKGQEALNVGALGALLLLSGLPILVYHLFRWLALAVLVFLPSLND